MARLIFKPFRGRAYMAIECCNYTHTWDQCPTCKLNYPEEMIEQRNRANKIIDRCSNSNNVYG